MYVNSKHHFYSVGTTAVPSELVDGLVVYRHIQWNGYTTEDFELQNYIIIAKLQ